MFSKTFKKQIVALAATLAFAATASANILVNPGFEDAPFGGAEEGGAGTGWTTFGNVFRVQGSGNPADPIGCTIDCPDATGAHGGSVALKAFGEAGAFQDISGVNAGDTVDAGAWIINPANADVLTGGQIGAVNIEWLDAGGNSFDFVSNGDTNSATTAGEWILRPVSGVAPAGTAGARITVITGPFAGAGGGAPRWDDAFAVVTPVPVPAAAWLFGSALAGLVAVRRKK